MGCRARYGEGADRGLLSGQGQLRCILGHADKIRPFRLEHRAACPKPIVLSQGQAPRRTRPQRRGRRVTVLATGDPMFFGVGVILARRFDPAEITVAPALGVYSLVCARLAWPLGEVEPVTLHGRPFDLLNLHVAPDARREGSRSRGGVPALGRLLRGAGHRRRARHLVPALGAAGLPRLAASRQRLRAREAGGAGSGARVPLHPLRP